MDPRTGEVRVALPAWTAELAHIGSSYPADEDRMALAIALAEENVRRNTGGPFGAAIFEEDSGVLVAVGVNSVVRLRNATLHAEMVAFMTAQASLGVWTLAAPGLPPHQLVTSCEPCAMCLGAILWSGVQSVMTGAARQDATDLGFDEGPVFADSYRYLEDRGIRFRRQVSRAAARSVLEQYRRQGGIVYNG